MKPTSLAKLRRVSMIACLLAGSSSPVMPQSGHTHDSAQNNLVNVVRENTAKYQDVAAAEADAEGDLLDAILLVTDPIQWVPPSEARVEGWVY